MQEWTKDARKAEKDAAQARAWDLWLDCHDQDEIAAELDIGEATISRWFQERRSAEMEPPDPHMAFDYWSYGKYDGDSTYFGKMHPGVVENLLWLFTEPGQVVFDPFVGAGTTIAVAKRMGRRVWASDRASSAPFSGACATTSGTGSTAAKRSWRTALCSAISTTTSFITRAGPSNWARMGTPNSSRPRGSTRSNSPNATPTGNCSATASVPANPTADPDPLSAVELREPLAQLVLEDLAADGVR